MDLAPKRILAAIDLDELSAFALKKAGFLARTFGAHLDVVHLYEVTTPSPPIPFPGANALRDEAVQARHEEVEAAVTKMIADHLGEAPHGLHVRHNASPGDATVEMAEELETDLLVIGSHHRRGIGRVLLGSVAEKIVRSAKCDVYVVRLPATE
jgi:nucleotide-binding universal stress UspA family protein